MGDIGHNSTVDKEAARHLLSFVKRIENLEAEEKALSDDKADVYGDAKSMGYDKKAMKRVIAARRKNPETRIEEDLIYETYWNALESVENPEDEGENE